MKQIIQTQKAINEARDIMESFDEGHGMTIGFDEPTYTLTAEQMTKIAAALYLADCEINNLTESQKYITRMPTPFKIHADSRQEIQAILEEMILGQYFTLRLYRSGEHQASITAHWNGKEYLITFEVFQTCQTTQQWTNAGAAALTLFEEARRWEEVVALELYEDPHPIF